jgi:hypothetical protein
MKLMKNYLKIILAAFLKKGCFFLLQVQGVEEIVLDLLE